MFSFLQSYFLWALAAVSLPVLIHFLNKRKPKRIRFSTLFFIKQLQQKKMRRLQIRQLLLLLLRALIIGLFVLAFARPTMKSRSFFLGEANVRTSAVIVMDNSMSMGLESPQGILYQLAERGAEQVLQQLKPGDQIGLVFSCPVPEYPVPRTFESSETVLTLLRKSHPTLQFADLAVAVNQAKKILRESIFPNKELFIFSDFQKSSWKEFLKTANSGADSEIRTFIYSVQAEEARNNAVEKVWLKNQIIEPGKTITVAANVNNFGREDASEVMIQAFLLNRRVGQNTVMIEAGRSKEVNFNLLLKEAGFVSGEIEIEDDPLLADNRGYFSFYLPEKIRLLLLGDEEDLHYFQLALAPNPEKQKLFHFEKTEHLQRLTSPLAQYAVVAVCDPQRLTDADYVDLIQYIRSGGHLLFFPGDHTDLRRVNEKMWAPLHVPLFRETRGTIGNQSSYIQWGTLHRNHAIFSDIFREKGKEIDSPRFYFRIILETKTSRGLDIIQFDDNTPFLHVEKAGKGSIFLFASALDPDWSDFVYKAIFPPLLYRSVIYLSSQASRSVTSAFAGEELVFEVYEPNADYLMIRPDGVSEKIIPGRSGTSLLIRYSKTQTPGIYMLKKEDQTIQQWAVNVNPLESELDVVPRARIKGLLGAQTFFLSSEENFAEQIKKYRFGSEITRWFLWGALLIMIVEMLLAKEDLLRHIPFLNRWVKEGTAS